MNTRRAPEKACSLVRREGESSPGPLGVAEGKLFASSHGYP